MITIITSTLHPPQATSATLYRNFLSDTDRLKQTIETIHSTKNMGEVYIFDNSYPAISQELCHQLKPANVYSIDVFPYQNKGLSEIYLLLLGLRNLPEHVPIFKISGRYRLMEPWDFDRLSNWDFAGKFDKPTTISTRAYYFRNKELFEEILLEALNFMYSYPARVVGPRSLLRIIKNAVKPNVNRHYFSPTLSIERCMGEVIRRRSLKVFSLQKLNIQGVSGNPDDHLKIVNE